MSVTDAEARRRALDASASFLVEAPAGSGKTELLIQRFLRLLAVVDQPESVVALTFTRKAAAEMKERVLRALREAAEDAPVKSEYAAATRALAQAALAQSQARDWRVLEDGRRLQIGTIDSFCALLTRQMPLLAGFGTTPEVVEFADELYALASRKAIVALAENPDWQEAFRDTAIHFDGNLDRLETLIADLLAKRDQWVRKIGNLHSDDLRSEIDDVLRETALERIERAFKLWPAGLAGRPAAELEALAQWCDAADTFLTRDGDPRKRKSFSAVVTAHQEFCDALHSCRQPVPPSLSNTQWRLISDFSALLQIALIQLERVFQERGQVDFTRISQAAVEALGTPEAPTELAYRLDFRIEHLLVDEFQDTSQVQYELLERLTAQWSAGDNRTLFLVGDPMQSIYRFRDAEVELFLRAAQDGIGNMRLEMLRLGCNFRSTREIVDWVNRTFRQIGPAQDDAERGEVCVRGAEAAREEAGVAPQIEIYANDTSGADEAELVVELADAAMRAEDDSTVAILVRARTHLRAILPKLRQKKVPYEAVDLDVLADEQHILDLLSLTRAIHQIADRAAWLACLRAPFCGLTLGDMAALVEGDVKTPILLLLEDEGKLALLSADGRQRARHLADILRQAIRGFGRRGVRELVEAAWIALGGPACLRETNHAGDAQSFFRLLERMEEGGRIPDFSLFKIQLEVLFAKPQAHARRHVQIMTIHKAKGLQFDTVIVPQLHGGTRSTEKDLLVWTTRFRADGSQTVLLAGLPQSADKNHPDNAYYDFVSNESKIKDKAEDLRLFYVAATRAKNKLYLLGNADEKKGGTEPKRPSCGFLRLLWPACEQELTQAWQRRKQSEPEQKAFSFSERPSTELRRLPAWWSLPSPEPAVPWRPSIETATVTSQQQSWNWVSETSRHVGTVVHDVLRRIAEDGLEMWNLAGVDRLRSYADDELTRLGVPSAERKAATRRIADAIRNVLESERGRWLLSAHASAECEWAIQGLVDGRLESARIDRTFVDEEGVRWIVDYKTSVHEGGSREKFLLDQEERYRGQLETYARLLQAAGETKVSVGLYFPLLNEWLAWSVPADEPVAEQKLSG